MHVGEFVRGKGKFLLTEYVPTDEKVNAQVSADPDDRPHPQPVQRRRADAAHARTSQWHDEDRLEIHPHDAEERGIKRRRLGRHREPRRRDRAARA